MMKLLCLRIGVLTFLLLGCAYQGASAESTFPSKCSSYGEIKKNKNPSYQHINCLLTNAALEANIPPEVVKAVATQENGWKQFNGKGEPVISSDGGIGLMQITNQPGYDQERLKYDIYYNIEAGVKTLRHMYFERGDLPKINGAGPDVIENWYFPVMAYNGIKPVNSPLYKSDGKRNTSAYQERVFKYLEQESFLNDTKLGQFPFTTADFKYETNSNKNIEFLKKSYTLSDQMHASVYLIKRGDRVVVTKNVNLRSQPSTSSSGSVIAKNTTLIIQGGVLYDQSTSSNTVNQFVWYPVKTEDQKFGYISSAYIMKKLDSPSVNLVDDNDTTISGKTLANVVIQIANGKNIIGTTTADAKGNFRATIKTQKAGTQLSVYFKDKLNAISPSKVLTVVDKTAPSVPTINTISDQSTEVSGKTESYATVKLFINGKYQKSSNADKIGNYKFSINKQKANTEIKVTAEDKGRNVSGPKSIKVADKTAPAMPTVNKVTTKSTSITGKAEKSATVYVYNGKIKLGQAIANAQGNYIVKIKVQKKGTVLSIYAVDSAKNKSNSRTTKVY